MGKPAVFLDRDEVLVAPVIDANGSRPPNLVSEMKLLPGVKEACQWLVDHRRQLIVVTNQAGVARGYMSEVELGIMHHELCRLLPLDCILACTHDTNDDCPCRKPKPGMLLDAQQGYGLDLANCVMVGDRMSDIEAGKAAGCKTVRIGTVCTVADYWAPTLLEAVPWILRNTNAID